MTLSRWKTACLLLAFYACGKSAGQTASTAVGAILCPSSLPTAGDACGDGNYLDCSYGGQCAPCGTGALCKDGRWTMDAVICENVNDLTACPTADPNTTEATPCATNGDRCHAGDSVCTCVIFANSANPNNQWGCTFPNTETNCPRWHPNTYGACTQEGTSCSYGCGGDGIVTCTKGVWEPIPTECAL